MIQRYFLEGICISNEVHPDITTGIVEKEHRDGDWCKGEDVFSLLAIIENGLLSLDYRITSGGICPSAASKEIKRLIDFINEEQKEKAAKEVGKDGGR